MEFGTIMTSVQNVLKITNRIKKKITVRTALSSLNFPGEKNNFTFKKNNPVHIQAEDDLPSATSGANQSFTQK